MLVGSGVELLHRAEVGDPGMAGTRCRKLPQNDVAGADEHYVHVTGDGRVAECFVFPVGSTAGSVVEASATLGYKYLGCTVVPHRSSNGQCAGAVLWPTACSTKSSTELGAGTFRVPVGSAMMR